MASFNDTFRALRRNIKAALPYVRRREYRILQRRYDELIEGLGWTAPRAAEARLHTLKPMAETLAGDVCFFVSFASMPQIKPHVKVHIEHLLRAGVRVVLILNTDLALDQIVVDPALLSRLSGAYTRENTGFDFAAWAHLYGLGGSVGQWSRLLLINDSIVGPLNAADFDRIMERVRNSPADVVGLTESQSPLPHLQSFFLVLNPTALRSPVIGQVFDRMLSLPTKGQVIDVYETRLTHKLRQQGLRCEALFPPLSDDTHSANDTSFRWDQLIRAGFPYIKTSVLDKFSGSRQIEALVPGEFRHPCP